MTDIKRLNLVLGIVAAVILISSCAAFAYTLIPQGDASKVIVNGMDFSWDDISEDYESVSFEAGDLEFEGVALDQIIIDSGIQDCADYEYKFVGADGYEKDVGWEDVETAYLALEDKMVVFPGLTKSFWVRDLITIDIVCENC
ncbi:MAG: hypothetical protein KAS67_04065 [Thermoplasmata archaeon]|nr:hypothetical protein [Thermoplasmata archaeon]